MPLKPEADQASQLITLFGPHNFPTDVFIRDTVWIGACFGILVKMRIVVRHSEIEERDSVIENRSSADDLSGMIIPQNTEIAKMTVFVVDDGIENEHAFQFFDSFFIRVKNANRLQELSEIDIRTVDPKELVDIKNVKISR